MKYYINKTINAEDKIGTILPCNVMLQEFDNGIEIAIINPKSMVSDIDNAEMKVISEEIYDKMQRVISNL